VIKWNPDKNKILFETRKITFDEVVQAIGDGYAVSDVPHWNQDKYPDQRIITVMINDYAYLAPYVIDGEHYYLKTIIPSRKANKMVRNNG
jgi:hypothetical protein